MQQKTNTIYLAIIVVFAALLIMSFGQLIAHHGKIKVSLIVQPTDSTVYVDGKKSSSGSVYLKPGQHTFLAKRQYFTDDKQSINITKPQKVYLLPSPDGQQAQDYLLAHPDIQAQREQAGGEQFNSASQSLADKYPIVNQLPYTDISGPFTINYGGAANNFYLIVSDSSPDGRRAALGWLAGQGYDPSKLDIRFVDFTNPLTGRSDAP